MASQKNRILTVLIGDGDTAQGRVMAFILEQLGSRSVHSYQCEVETVPASVMRKFIHGTYDVMILDADLQKPGGGLQLAQLLMMRKHQETPIILLTSRVDQETVRQALGIGVVDIMVKPFHPDTFLEKVEKIIRDRGGMTEDDLAQNITSALRGITQIPTLAPIFARVQEFLRDPEPSVEKISQVIEIDPAMTMRLLRLANSAYFGFTKRVKTIRQAITLIGFRATQTAVLALSTFEAVGKGTGSAGLDRIGLWQHAVGTGYSAMVLEQKLNVKGGNGFIGGLLHDVGKIILDAFFPEYYAPVLVLVKEQNISLLEAERRNLGLSHAEVGAQIATLWDLPTDLVEVIAHHHQPMMASKKVRPTTALITVADVVCRKLGIGNAGEPIIPSIDQAVLDILGLRPDVIDTYLPEIEEGAKKSVAFLTALQGLDSDERGDASDT